MTLVHRLGPVLNMVLNPNLRTQDDEGVDDSLPDGLTDCHLAAYGGGARMVQLLLATGADPNAVTTADTSVGPEGSSPLHVAAAAGHASIVQLLLAGGASTDVTDSVCARVSALLHLRLRLVRLVFLHLGRCAASTRLVLVLRETTC